MDSEKFINVPYVSIRPGYISRYSLPEDGNGNLYRCNSNRDGLEYNRPDGVISAKAKSRIRNSIDWMLLLSTSKKVFRKNDGKLFKFRLSFFTLTLASKQIHSDIQIKHDLLNHFIVELHNKWNVKNYLWRAESQMNGNIHFHVTCDRYIPWWELRNTWNRIQDKLGYVARYSQNMQEFHKNGFKVRKDLLANWSFEKQLNAYKVGQKEGWYNPNTTDIHSVRNIKNLSHYLAKEFTKNQGKTPEYKEGAACPIGYLQDPSKYNKNKELRKLLLPRKIQGVLWRLSEFLSGFQSAISNPSTAAFKELDQIFTKFKHKLKTSEYYQVCFVSINDWIQITGDALLKIFDEYLSEKGLQVVISENRQT